MDKWAKERTSELHAMEELVLHFFICFNCASFCREMVLWGTGGGDNDN